MHSADCLALAVDILAVLSMDPERRSRSGWISDVGASRETVRGIVARLHRAGLVRRVHGYVGVRLAMPLREITLGDVYRAVAEEGAEFRLYWHRDAGGSFGHRTQRRLAEICEGAQRALEGRLDAITVEAVLEGLWASEGEPTHRHG